MPRYRPFVMQAEGNVDADTARRRALWRARRDAAESLSIRIVVQGWRQQDGRLWQINERVPVQLPSFGVDEEMLVATVSHTLSSREGRRTTLTLGLPGAFTPEPIEAAAGGGRSPGWVQSLPPGGGRE